MHEDTGVLHDDTMSKDLMKAMTAIPYCRESDDENKREWRRFASYMNSQEQFMSACCDGEMDRGRDAGLNSRVARWKRKATAMRRSKGKLIKKVKPKVKKN